MREYRTIRGEHFVAKEGLDEGTVEVTFSRRVSSKQLAYGIERMAAWAFAHASDLELSETVKRMVISTRVSMVGSVSHVMAEATIYRELGDAQWVAELEETWWKAITPHLQLQGLLEDYHTSTRSVLNTLENRHKELAESVQHDGRLVNNELDDLRAEIESARVEMENVKDDLWGAVNRHEEALDRLEDERRDEIVLDIERATERARAEMLDALRKEKEALAQRIEDLERVVTVQHDEEVARAIKVQAFPRWRRWLRRMVGLGDW